MGEKRRKDESEEKGDPVPDGMTNYPTGPNRTESDLSALNIVLPPANPTTVTHSLTYVHHANMFDHRYTRKVTDINTIVTNLL